ncbi:MAG: DUF4139 domain-containing protein [Saprospiraceae bacterium]|nr:DUF4139 domain-containing protein [Saprospiraceae bacterium]
MKHIWLFVLFVATQTVLAQPKNLTSTIEKVTVFFNGAQVTRTTSTPLSTGRTELVFKGLTPSLDTRSVQVRGEGDFTVLSVTPRTNFLESAAKKDTIKDLEQELEVLQDRLTLENNQLSVLQQEESFLQRNQVQILGVSNTALKLDDLKQVAEYQRIRLSEILNKKFDIQKDVSKVQQSIARIRLQLNEMNAKKNTITSEVVVVVNTNAATSAKLILTYVVPSAGWIPTYDMRVKDIVTPLSMQMKAHVQQATGEDWKDVKLTLSSGNPMESGVKPELKTWNLGFVQLRSKLYDRLEEVAIVSNVPQAAKKERAAKNNNDDEIPKTAGAFSLQVTERQQTTTSLFEIELPYTIPSDNKPQTVEIKDLEVPATYQYFVAPKLDKDAFLTAQVVDWEQYNLLSGEANLFFEGTFMGKTVLNTLTTDDTLNISLGRDKNVVVTRTKLKDFTKSKFLSDKRTDSRGFETIIKNKRNQPLSITVEDQIPISSTKDIEIVPETGDAAVEATTGKLTWKLDIPASKEKKVKFNYKVTYPKTQKVILE